MERAVEKTALKILMITSEIVPFVKVGGLGDMVAALSAELARLGHDVRVVLPRYLSVSLDRMQRVGGALGVPMGSGEAWCAVYGATLPGVEAPVYFLDHEELFGRDGVYGTREEPSFHDNLARFAVLCRGAFQLCRMLEWFPNVMHAHDWPAALIPVYLNTLERGDEFAATASVLTIHNVGYQGEFPRDEFPVLQLPWQEYHGAGLEARGRVNLLRAGVLNADLLTTVSPTYAREIQSPELGHGLDGLLRHRAPDLFGVLNGMDYEAWNPETDPYIPAPYSEDDLSGKEEAKAVLQARMGLPVDRAVPVIGMVSRLVEQKGLGELCGPSFGSLYTICRDLALQFVVLGTGARWCEDELTVLAAKLDNLRVVLEFSEELAHLIEAGSDFFLMPSRYEPCGLNQMYSLRYGTLPIVRRTGGLADTVGNYDEQTGEGTGFVFDDLSPKTIYDTVGWAVWAWYNRQQHIARMRRRAMQMRFSWESSASRYAELFRWAMDRRSGSGPKT